MPFVMSIISSTVICENNDRFIEETVGYPRPTFLNRKTFSFVSHEGFFFIFPFADAILILFILDLSIKATYTTY